MALPQFSHRPSGTVRPVSAIIVTLAILSVWFGGLVRPAPVSAASTRTVIGTVHDTAGAPVGDVSIVVHGSPHLEAHSQSDGTYRINNVPVGERTLDVAPVCKPALSQAIGGEGNQTVNVTVQERNTFDAFSYACRPVRAFGFGTTDGTGLSGDDAVKAVGLPFDFPFYGTARTTAFVSTNGFLSFTAPSTAFANTHIPSSGGPEAAIYAFWDDLVIDGAASVTTALSGAAPFRQFIIAWSGGRAFVAVLQTSA